MNISSARFTVLTWWRQPVNCCPQFAASCVSQESALKLLITSVGSLVGKNILDVLEYPGLSRRASLQIVGTNSVADAPNNFRCDRCYLVPETAAADYGERVRDVLSKERPDLILCGRDADTLALSRLRAEGAGFHGALPVGTPASALIGLDKWETWQFSRRHGLPMAESFVPGRSGDAAAFDAFLDRAAYPLVAKPVQGFASRGVYFARNAADVRALAQRKGYLFQEYLGDPQVLQSYFESLSGPPPLYAQPPRAGHYSCQTVIAPDGTVAPAFVIYVHLEYGMALSSKRVENAELDELTVTYARALAGEGVAGPVNLAFREDRHGRFKLQEVNLRNSGSTLARFILGMDELYLIARAFVPEVSFPELHPSASERSDHISKFLTVYAIPHSHVETLKTAGVWSARTA